MKHRSGMLRTQSGTFLFDALGHAFIQNVVDSMSYQTKPRGPGVVRAFRRTCQAMFHEDKMQTSQPSEPIEASNCPHPFGHYPILEMIQLQE